MSTCISRHGEYGQHIVDANYTCERCGVLDDDALIAELVRLRAERDEAKAQYENLRNERILSIIFGHHPGAPKPFALYRKNADRVATAVGAEFPDGAVAVRLNHDGGWFTYSEGGAQRVADADDLRLVWLSDELEPLAQMEQERDAARAEVAAADQRGYERAIEVLRTADMLVGVDNAEWWRTRDGGRSEWVKGAAAYLESLASSLVKGDSDGG